MYEEFGWFTCVYSLWMVECSKRGIVTCHCFRCYIDILVI